MLINWDNYPNVATGGVYTWVKNLVDSMPDWEFVVVNQLSNSNASSDYNLPEHVKQVIALPIFGTMRHHEYCNNGDSFVSKILRTTDHAIQQEFLPLFDRLLTSIIADQCDTDKIIDSVFRLQKFLSMHDFKKCFENPHTWEIFREKICDDPLYKRMQLREAVTVFQVLQRGLQVLSIQVPKVDLIHCSLAWLPSLIAVAPKLEGDIPLLVTEHGVAFRELLMYYNGYMRNEVSKIFWKVFSRNIVRAIYSIADKILPVCVANETWEIKLGAQPSKIRVIYNGVDTQRFKPLEIAKPDNRPTVVSIARVDIFKDIIGLMQAVKYTRERIPNIQCLLFGGSIDLDYSLRCMRAFRALDIDGNFKFMGKTQQPEIAYNMGDVVVFSAITEGFPFSVIEAMACGKAIVASDVGGVREALGDCGLLVRSRRPREIANGIVELLQNEKLRTELGKAALERARAMFTLKKSTNEYRQLYEDLTTPSTIRQARQATEMMVAP